MTRQKCECAKPILRERAETKGSSESYCARCKRPLGLRLAAIRHGAGVEEETQDPTVAYARFRPSKPTRYRDGWLPDL